MSYCHSMRFFILIDLESLSHTFPLNIVYNNVIISYYFYYYLFAFFQTPIHLIFFGLEIADATLLNPLLSTPMKTFDLVSRNKSVIVERRIVRSRSKSECPLTTLIFVIVLFHSEDGLFLSGRRTNLLTGTPFYYQYYSTCSVLL